MVDVVGTGTSNCVLAIADAGINMRAGINNLSLLVMRLPYDGDCSDASINRTVMFMVTFFWHVEDEEEQLKFYCCGAAFISIRVLIKRLIDYCSCKLLPCINKYLARCS